MAASGLLAGRYAFARRVRGTQRTIIWIARDEQTRSNVVASVLSPSRVAGLAPAVGIVHPHAAAVLAVVDRFEPEDVPSDEPPAADAQIVIAELLEGRSLQQRLDAGPVTLENAVEWTTSIADAVATLHARGAVHGAIAPRAVLVIRPEPAVVPALTHLVVPPSGAYCSPERVTGEGPSKSDDLWALAATLYTAMARRPPFQGATRTDLARAIVAAAPAPLDDVDADLWAIVARALSRDPQERFESAEQLRDALREWTEMTGRRSLGDFAPVEALVGVTEEPPNVGDLSLVAALVSPESAEARAPLDFPVVSMRPSIDPEAHSDPSELAPLAARPHAAAAPQTLSTTAVVASTPEAKPRRRTGAVLLALAVAAAGGAALLLTRKAEPPVTRSPAMSAAASSVVPAPPSSGAPPMQAAPVATEEASAEAPSAAPAPSASVATESPPDPSTCAAATLPDGTAGPSPEMAFLCTGTDLWGLTRKVDQLVLKHGKGDGLVLWAHLGRFDLAAVALLRQRCCPGAPELTAATPKGLCETLGSSVRELSTNPDVEHLDAYAAAVECIVSHGIRYPEEWWDRVGAKPARGAFEQFVSALPHAPR